MSTATIREYQELVYQEIVCGGCGIKYFVPDNFRKSRLDDGKTFFCPNGCQRCFTDSMQTKLDAANAQLALERDQKAAAQEALDRLKKRTSKGVCPCCKRTFSQLQRHMVCKHPDYPKPA